MVMKKNLEKERVKFEAAAELGLADKLKRVGWGGLTSEETGRVGAAVAGRKRKGGSGEAAP
jgi:hypothetical protein